MSRADTSRIEKLRGTVRDRLVSVEPRIRRLAQDVHRWPELACGEFQTVARLTGELEEEGFSVDTNVAGLPTAFRAERRSGPGPTIALLAEYDAIPGLGHAAGHNLIVGAVYGAAVALAEALPELAGAVVVFGAPAEETIGGKVVLAARGAFDGVDVALLTHPEREDRARVASLASWSFEVAFEGRSAHAVAAPHEGINALDAMIQLFVARDALLKALRPGVRMPGVILEGGVRPNLVPAHSRARFSLRATDSGYLAETVAARFREAVQGVATSTGTRATVRPIDNLYEELLPNETLAATWDGHAKSVGLEPVAGMLEPLVSLDIGRLSHSVPCLHPLFRVTDDSGAVAYTPEFADSCRTESAYRATARAAAALALTGLDLLADGELLERVQAEHRERSGPARSSIDAPLIVEPAAT